MGDANVLLINGVIHVHIVNLAFTTVNTQEIVKDVIIIVTAAPGQANTNASLVGIVGSSQTNDKFRIHGPIPKLLQSDHADDLVCSFLFKVSIGGYAT
jgi:hypothetical protein